MSSHPAAPAPAPAQPGLDRFLSQELSWGPCTDFARTDADRQTFADPKFDCTYLEVPLDYADPGGRTARLVLGGSAMEERHLARERVDLDVDRIPDLQRMERGMRHRVRDQRDFEAGVVGGVDGQADAIHAHRTLVRNVAQQRHWRREPPAHRARIVLPRLGDRQPVDVAADQVPAEAVGRQHRALEVERRAVGQSTQRGERERLVRGIGLEMRAVEGHHGQADAIDRDALARLGVRERQRADMDAQAGVATAGFAARQVADGFDDSGEHGPTLPRPPHRRPARATAAAAGRRQR